MKKLVLILISFVVIANNTIAQASGNSCTIMGIVKDKTSNDVLPGATVMDGNFNGVITDYDGKFTFPVKSDNSIVNLKIGFTGYKSVVKKVRISGGVVNLGTILLTEDITNLGEIIVKGKAPIAKQETGRTSFNANAVKVHADAKGSNLIKKLPGFTVKQDKIETQGEEVKKIYINGKPFFEDDPKKALNSIPAEMIKNIELYDDYGEVAEFTGYSSGNSVKAINIVTKDEFLNKRVGSYKGGLGTDGKYDLQINRMVTKKNYDFTMSGDRNNINRSNSDLSDFKSFEAEITSNIFGKSDEKPQNFGEQKLTSFGFNLNKKIKKKNDLSLNFTTGKIGNKLEQQSIQNYQDTWYYDSKDTSKTDTRMYKLNLKFTRQNSKDSKVIFSQKTQFMNGNSDSHSERKGILSGTTLNSANTYLNSESDKLYSSSTLIWLKNFEESGRSLTSIANFTTKFNNQDNNIVSDIERYSLNKDNSIDTLVNGINQNELSGTSENSTMLRVSFKEPVDMLSNLNFVYKSSFSTRNSDKNIDLFNINTQNYDLFMESGSNKITSDYWSNRAEIGYSSFGLRFIFNVGLAYENTTLMNTLQYHAEESKSEKTYHKVLPVIYGKYFFSSEQSLVFYAGSRTVVPSVQQLQPLVSMSNPLQVSIGNPELEVGTHHMAMTRYTFTLSEKSNYLAAYAFLKYGENTPGIESYFLSEDAAIHGVTLQKGTKVTKPINVDGMLNVMSGVDYSFPLSFIKSNLNTGLRYNYTYMPTVMSGVELKAKNHNGGLNVGLVSNISKNIDFNINNTTSYNYAYNSENENYNEFLTHNLNADVNITFWKGISLNVEYQYNGYEYFGEEKNQEFHLLNFSVGKSFLKNNRASIRFYVYDALNQNKGIAFNLHETYNESIKSNPLQQYYMLKFSWRL